MLFTSYKKKYKYMNTLNLERLSLSLGYRLDTTLYSDETHRYLKIRLLTEI